MSRSIPTEDRISSLPDPILHHILSFLPTKSAATTSILSKRWNPLWLSVPTLHFDDTPFEDFISFRHFVLTVFLLRDITLPIRSFNLNCSQPYTDAYDINRYVYAAVQRGGIENLKLFCRLSLNIKVPDSIFTCKTLVVLHLTEINVNDLSNVFVNLPRLKTLHLHRIFFHNYEDLPKLLSRCPILEELHIIDVPRIFYLDENFQCLPKLIRANISIPNLLTSCCRAEVLRVEMDLIYLKWNCQFPMYLNLTDIKLILKNDHHAKWKWLLELLNHCPQLQNLTIHQRLRPGNESLDNWTDPALVPECLSTQLRTCSLKGYKNTNCEIQFAKYILQNSKVLNTMSIKSYTSVDLNVKHQMIIKLTSSRRASTTCEVLFD